MSIFNTQFDMESSITAVHQIDAQKHAGYTGYKLVKVYFSELLDYISMKLNIETPELANAERYNQNSCNNYDVVAQSFDYNGHKIRLAINFDYPKIRCLIDEIKIFDSQTPTSLLNKLKRLRPERAPWLTN